MNEEEPDFAAQRMADLPGLEGGLLDIDGDVPAESPLPPKVGEGVAAAATG